jgi:hypothetical protein
MERNNFSRLEAMIAVTLAVLVVAWMVAFGVVLLRSALT